MFVFVFVFNFENAVKFIQSTQKLYDCKFVIVFQDPIMWLCQIYSSVDINGDRAQITYVCTQTFAGKHCTIIQ